MAISFLTLGDTKVSIHITFFVSAIILCLSGYTLQLIVFAGSLFVHEMGHILGAAFMGAQITSVEIWPFGCVAKIERTWQLSPLKESFVALAGPFNSGVLACAAGFVEKYLAGNFLTQYPLLDFLSRTNFLLFAVNLIPCLPLDGGRFLRSQMSLSVGYLEASKKVSKLSVFLGTIITALGIASVAAGKDGYGWLVLGPVIVWGALEEKDEARLTNILNILTRDGRLGKKRAISVAEIMVPCDAKVGEVMTKLRPSKYNKILVAGKNMEIIGIVSEKSLLEAFYRGDINAGITDLIKNAPRV